MKTDEKTTEVLQSVAGLVQLLTQAGLGEHAGFVLLVTDPDAHGGSAVHVRTNLCEQHAAQAMVEVGMDYAERHGVKLDTPAPGHAMHS